MPAIGPGGGGGGGGGGGLGRLPYDEAIAVVSFWYASPPILLVTNFQTALPATLCYPPISARSNMTLQHLPPRCANRNTQNEFLRISFLNCV
mmetsp:Transcript_2037/g.4702  ORF Transcript_2037/g.4702 Transcript_2037/m.4702 type:complete len:92 (-) Transcript_2037:196-471(-)